MVEPETDKMSFAFMRHVLKQYRKALVQLSNQAWSSGFLFRDDEVNELKEAVREARTYMETMTNGPGDGPGMWLRRYEHILRSL